MGAITPDTMKHCFEKCGFPTENYAAVSSDFDEEFQTFQCSMKYLQIVLSINI